MSISVSIRPTNKKRRKIVFVIVLVPVAIMLIGNGLWSFWRRYQATHMSQVDIQTETVTHSTDEPGETPPPDDCNGYQTGYDQPYKIEVPSVEVSGCIQKVGVDQNNSIAVPTNIHLAGWYTNSVLPGDKGVSIIDGHVLGRYQDAIFVNLKDIRPGDIIRIQFGDETWKEFEVIVVNSYPVNEVMDHLLPLHSGLDSQLNLITCGGNYDKNSHSYDQRVVVKSKLISNNE